MRVLWCHEVSYREKPVYEYQDFPERLAARGHDVEVIDFREHEVTELLTEPLSRTGEGTVQLTSIPHSGKPILKYLEARWAFRKMLHSRLDAQKVDVAVVYSVFINGTTAVDLCRRYSVPVLCRVLDAYHRLRPGFLTREILKRGEQYVYRHADRVLATNEQMVEYVCRLARLDERDSRLSVLDHGVDTVHFAARSPDSQLAERYGIVDGDDVALFLGTTYSFSGLVELVRCMPWLIEERPRLKLVIVGGGEQDAALAELVGNLGLRSRVILTGMVPYEEVPRYLALGTLALNPFTINDITRDIVPIKILQYQACGLPVLSTPLPDVVRKHPSEISGVLFSPSDRAEDFAATLIGLLSSRDALSAIGERGARYVADNYSARRTIDRLELTLEELVSPRRTRTKR